MSNKICHECGGTMHNNFEFLPAPAGFGARLHPSAEMELAMELLSVSSEAEMDQFLGKLLKKAWSGIKKVGSFVGKIAKPLGGVLKGLAKKALPFVGGALGSLIPIPGVGTMVGKALGTAVSNALEMEFGHLQQEDQELEMARRFVRIAHSAASQLAHVQPGQNLAGAIDQAVLQAARQNVPNLDLRAIQRGAASIGRGGFGFTGGGAKNNGGWKRVGGNIVLEL